MPDTPLPVPGDLALAADFVFLTTPMAHRRARARCDWTPRRR
ncbi:hypothetical protein [Azospirillum sp.]|nr:hypothetical protein [Azospirillum sp.]